MKEKRLQGTKDLQPILFFSLEIHVMCLALEHNSVIAVVESYEDMKYNINSFSKEKKMVENQSNRR